MGITLVTGAAGFIGSHIAEALVKSDRRVRGLVQPQSLNIDFLRNTGAEVVYGDILDKESVKSALEGVDSVFHLAANVRPSKWVYSRTGLLAEFNKVNFEGTKVLADEAKGRVKSFVFYSSIAAAGVGPMLDETSTTMPETDYGMSKRNAEIYLSKLHEEEGFPVKMIRPGSVYGARNRNMGLLYRFFDYNFCPTIGTGHNTLPFTYVENLVKATLLIEEKAPDGEKYFVTEDPVSMRDFANGSAAAMGKKLNGFYLPTGFMYGSLLFKEALERLLFLRLFPMRMDVRLESVRIASGNWICSNAKLKKLGYTPAVGFEESLVRTVKWYKDNGVI